MSTVQPGWQRKPLTKVVLTFCFGCLLALMPLLPGAAISVADVSNPQQANGTWVTDMAELIDSETETRLNQMISQLEAENGTEMAVVTVPDTAGSASPKAFATELFNLWGIGKEGVDNGLLFLISKGDRRTEVETGYGIEGLLSDGQVGNILDTRVTPQFKAGNFSQGILSGTEAMVQVLQGNSLTEPPSGITATAPYANRTAQNSRPQPSSQPVYLEPASATSWFETLLWLIFLASIAPGVVVVKRLKKGEILYEAPPLQIKPVGRSHSYKMASPWLYLWTITWVGEGVQATNPDAEAEISLWDFSGCYKWNERLAVKSGWLAAHHRNQQFNRRGSLLFWGLFGISVLSMLSSVILSMALLLEVFMALCWLGYEIKMSTQANGRVQSISFTLVKLTLISLTVGFTLVIAGLITGGLVWILSPSLLVASLGTSAGLIRLLRVSPVAPKIVCETCDRAMQQLSSTDLTLHLSNPQLLEIDLGSRACEGWHCKNCVPTSEVGLPDKSEIRLFFFDRKKKGIETCRTCQAKTLEVTTKILRTATTNRSGSKCITRECHSCGEHSEKTVTIPRKSSSSGSSSYSGGSYSGGSSGSSSSSSGGGGSFGGGSSGGGGAGSSW